jgi:SAM-dependent methyltransferase
VAPIVADARLVGRSHPWLRPFAAQDSGPKAAAAILPASIKQQRQREALMTDIDWERWWEEGLSWWTKRQPRWSAMTAPLDDALVAAIEACPGMHVLDVACGNGDPVLSLARAVGDTGRVTGADPVEGMLEVARRRLALAGLSNADFVRGGFGPLPFEDGSFDAATCRFGLVYVANPVLAMRELARVVAPSGKVAVMVWGDRHRNEYWSIDYDARNRLPLPHPRPWDDLVEFLYEQPGRLAEVFRAAGLDAVTEQELELTLRWPGPPEELLQEALDETAELDVSEDARRRFSDEVLSGLRVLADDGGVVVRSTFVLAVATV